MCENEVHENHSRSICHAAYSFTFLDFLSRILKRQTNFASENLFLDVLNGPGNKNCGGGGTEI